MTFPGRFITLEGLDGSGKSTQLTRIAEYLRQRGLNVVSTREPGGTELGQQIRDLLLHPSRQTVISPHTELALMFAARAQHVEQVIVPALRSGTIVVCDRFTDSSVAYQAYGRGMAIEEIRMMESLLCHGVRPDLTLLLDIDASAAVARTARRNDIASQPHTRFEREGVEFFERVRHGYLAIARDKPGRVKVIDGSLPVEAVWEAVQRALDAFLKVQADEQHGI
jgi:dTMP kinase